MFAFSIRRVRKPDRWSSQIAGRLLTANNFKTVVLDASIDHIELLRRFGRRVHYGDATRPEYLRRCGIERARAVVVTMDSTVANEAVVETTRRLRPDVTLVARARDAEHARALYALGVTDAVPETIEASLQLSEAVLVDLGVPMGPVLVSIHEQRARLQSDIKAMAPEADVRPLGRSRLQRLTELRKPAPSEAPEGTQ